MSNNVNPFKTLKKKTFVNWHETVDQPLKQIVSVRNGDPNKSTVKDYAATTKRIQKLVTAASTQNTNIRAFGGGWSFSEVAATSGILLDTWNAAYKFRVKQHHKNTKYQGKVENLLFVQCGNSIENLNRYFESENKSLKTMGASNGQTIVGAMSTGTHGSAIEVGSIQDYIVGIHLIVSGTKDIWLERDSAPVVNKQYWKNFADDIVRDDDLFNAALVSFGSMGIIHGVMIEATDLFYLNSSRKLIDFDDGMWKAITKLDFTGIENSLPRPLSEGEPFHFKAVIEPNDRSQVAATIIYKDKTEPDDCNPAPPPGNWVQGDNVFEFLGILTDILGEDILADKLSSQFKKMYKEYEGRCGTLGETFPITTTRGKASSTALGISMNEIEKALKIVFAEYDKSWAPVVVAVRYVKVSKATLAFTSHDPITCILEIDGPRSDKVTKLTKNIWNALDVAGINYTFHWGKLNNLTKSNVKKRYGAANVDAWVNARRKLLPTPKLRQVFANDFLKRLGLDD